MNRFIKTDRRANLLLQLGMIENVVVGQRLLHHHQIEFIERFEEPHIIQRVS